MAKAADQDPLNDPDVQKALRAMADASTWYHPDLFGEFAGMRHYAHHDYAGALKYFKVGAYYSDKLSQLSIGLMYMNGEGVTKDLPTAYAWLAVAAERKYPEFEATRDSVKAQLSPDQLAQAERLRAAVDSEYGDKVAKHRLVLQLNQGRMKMTGSHTGFDFGTSQLNTKNCSGPSIMVGDEAVPQAGCGGGIYAKWRWDPKTYFAVRDAHWKATVSVGALNDVGTAADKAKASSAGKPEETTPDATKQ
ncbi:MAG: sel1 repeat family protein [Proteobacteria bacterium]|nr:sel1 repeat family protein [Pseudomonadota bacterium]